ncbi:endonuclease VII [Mycobacterium phage Phillis]|nr:endonuclease VII [Mycobacterium phage Phillis]
MATVECKDCIAEGITNVRKPATTRGGKPVPGKRCVTHHRARRQTTRDAAWERRLMDTYGITAEEYWEIYEFQGGCCYICRRATGKGRKKLSVDHCHTTGFVRGLLCGPCNRDVLGHLRDEPEAFLRGYNYLSSPPAIAVIGRRVAPIELKAA